jgi:MATE family multidrug resistance protein
MRSCAMLALPLAGAQLGQVALGVVTTRAMGALGTSALAGGALGWIVFSTLLVSCAGVLSSVGVLVARAQGTRSPRDAANVTAMGLWLAIALAALAIILMARARTLFELLAQPPEVMDGAIAFLHWSAWAFPAALGFLVLRNFVSAIGKPHAATLVMVGGVALAHVATRTLIAGNLGTTLVDLRGIALVAGGVQLAMFFALAAYVAFTQTNAARLIYQAFLRFDRPMFLELLRVGAPVGVAFALEAGLFSVTGVLAGRLGSTALAAHQIASQSCYLTFMIPSGIGMAATIRVALADGAGDVRGARRAGWSAMLLAVVVMSLATAVFSLAAPEVVALYVDVDDERSKPVVTTAVRLLAIAGAFQVVDGLQGVAAGALRGMKDTRVPMYISVIAYWGIGLTVGYAVAFVARRGVDGLWWGIAAGVGSAAALLVWRYRQITSERMPVTHGASR